MNLEEAEWVDGSKKEIKVFFRRYREVLTHFVDAFVAADESVDGQLPLFPES